MAILGNFETTMIQKQSMVILVNFKENYDTTTTTIQCALTSVQFNLVNDLVCVKSKNPDIQESLIRTHQNCGKRTNYRNIQKS